MMIHIGFFFAYIQILKNPLCILSMKNSFIFALQTTKLYAKREIHT